MLVGGTINFVDSSNEVDYGIAAIGTDSGFSYSGEIFSSTSRASESLESCADALSSQQSSSW